MKTASRKVEQLLEPVVGVGNVRAQFLQIDPQRVITNEERYDPDGQVLQFAVHYGIQPKRRRSVRQRLYQHELADTSTAGEGAGTLPGHLRVEEANNFEITRASATRSKKPARSSSFVAVAINTRKLRQGEERERRQYGSRTPEESSTLE